MSANTTQAGKRVGLVRTSAWRRSHGRWGNAVQSGPTRSRYVGAPAGRELVLSYIFSKSKGNLRESHADATTGEDGAGVFSSERQLTAEMNVTYFNLRRRLSLSLVKLALCCAELLMHLTIRELLLADTRGGLQHTDPRLRVLQLLYESGDFLLLHLCQIRQRRRSRKSAAYLQRRRAWNVGCIPVCHIVELATTTWRTKGQRTKRSKQTMLR